MKTTPVAASAAAHPSSSSNHVLRVLVVDDHEPTRRASALFLKSRGCTVAEAADGGEAVALYFAAAARGQAFSVVVLDLHMPEGASGGKAMIDLLTAKPRPRIVLCTGDTENPLTREFSYYGFDGRVTKPFELEQLWSEVARTAAG